jgi:hypothetical protein
MANKAVVARRSGRHRRATFCSCQNDSAYSTTASVDWVLFGFVKGKLTAASAGSLVV